MHGTKHKHGLRTSFSGLAFLNTPVQLSDASVAVNDTVFAETEFVSLIVKGVNLPRLDLLFNNAVFNKNFGCLTIFPHGSNVFINITNTDFRQNGDLSSDLPLIYLFDLDSEKNLINIELRNCSFKKNTLKTPPIIFVLNQPGTTNVFLSQFQLEANSHITPSFKENDGTFCFFSTQVFLSLEYGIIFEVPATFLSVVAQSAEINISNIQVNGFSSSTPGRGVFYVFVEHSCTLSVKNSSFLNGKNSSSGGIVYIAASNSTLTIQNSTFYNVSTSHLGGAGYIQSIENAHLSITNASFSNIASNSCGGVVFVFAKQLWATICDSLFLRNRVTISGSILCFYSNGTSSITFHNDIFQENRVDNGQIVFVFTPPEKCLFNFSLTNALFVNNRVCKFSPFHLCAIINLLFNV